MPTSGTRLILKRLARAHVSYFRRREARALQFLTPNGTQESEA